MEDPGTPEHPPLRDPEAEGASPEDAPVKEGALAAKDEAPAAKDSAPSAKADDAGSKSDAPEKEDAAPKGDAMAAEETAPAAETAAETAPAPGDAQDDATAAEETAPAPAVEAADPAADEAKSTAAARSAVSLKAEDFVIEGASAVELFPDPDDEAPAIEVGPSPEDAAKAKADALLGRVLSQRYRIVELLAMGGMGAVYRGEHLLLKKRIAIKILHPEIENLPELVSRFEREAIAGAHIQHPNVAAATDFGQLDDGSYFLILEYVRGTTLHHAIKKGAFDPARAVSIARQIASALAAAHAMDVVHRDVKPRNVMLIEGEDDHAKLIDFGLAKVSLDRLTVEERRRSLLDEQERRPQASKPDRDPEGSNADDPSEGDRLTDVGVIFGTIAYLAPEAALGMDAVDARADLYALGIILYEMLTGLHPFEGADAVELFKHQRYTPPPPFADRAPDVSVPAALEEVVMRLLEKDPAARYQTGKEVIAALDAAVGRTSERPGTPTPREEAATEPALDGSDPPSAPARSTPVPRSEPPVEKVAVLPTAVRSKVPIKAKVPSSMPPPPDPAEAPDPPKKKKKKKAPQTAKTGQEKDPKGKDPKGKDPKGKDPKGREQKDDDRDQNPKRRSPWLEVVILFAIAATGLIMFVKLRFQPHLTPKPPPATPTAETTASSPTPLPAAPTASASATETSPSAEPPVSSAPTPADSAAAGALAGVDAQGLRVVLLKAAHSHDWPGGEAALLGLAERDPAAFSRGDVITATRDIVAGLEHDGHADKAFETLANRLGEPGLDLLYEIVQAKGGSRAATRAGDLLRQDAIRARESPALKIAFEIREASCVDKLKLLDRAVSDGDARTLIVLQSQGVACFRKSKEMDAAIAQLKSKLTKAR